MIYLYFSNNNKPPVKWKTYVYECVCFLGLENAEHNHQMQNIILHFCNLEVDICINTSSHWLLGNSSLECSLTRYHFEATDGDNL